MSGKQYILQGMILLPLKDFSGHLYFARQPMARLDEFCREYGLGRKEFALDYAWQKTQDATRPRIGKGYLPCPLWEKPLFRKGKRHLSTA